MSTQHTPGPWRATHDGYISSDNGYVPFVSPFREDAHRDKHRNPTPEAMANARLIAASPRSLEALKAVASAHAHIETANMPEWLDMVEIAIAEAEGE